MLDAAFYDLVERLIPRRVQARIRRLVKDSKCLLCEKDASEGDRGLCPHCYNQFNYAHRLAAAEGQKALAKFERQEVAAGCVLRSQRGKSRKRKNPFLARLAS